PVHEVGLSCRSGSAEVWPAAGPVPDGKSQGRDHMKRRDFMISAGALAAGMTLLPRAAQAAPGTIDWFTSSDQNVLDFWTNVVKPGFEAANPGVTLNLVDGGDNSGLQVIAERALAA